MTDVQKAQIRTMNFLVKKTIEAQTTEGNKMNRYNASDRGLIHLTHNGDLCLWKDAKQLQVDIDLMAKQIDEQNKEIIRLQAELNNHRWILVSERLPELFDIPNPHSADVLIAYETPGSHTAVLGYYDKEKGWVIYSSYQAPDKYQKEITHWKPIILPD